jgi:hypothetical protein
MNEETLERELDGILALLKEAEHSATNAYTIGLTGRSRSCDHI